MMSVEAVFQVRSIPFWTVRTARLPIDVIGNLAEYCRGPA